MAVFPPVLIFSEKCQRCVLCVSCVSCEFSVLIMCVCIYHHVAKEEKDRYNPLATKYEIVKLLDQKVSQSEIDRRNNVLLFTSLCTDDGNKPEIVYE